MLDFSRARLVSPRGSGKGREIDVSLYSSSLCFSVETFSSLTGTCTPTGTGLAASFAPTASTTMSLTAPIVRLHAMVQMPHEMPPVKREGQLSRYSREGWRASAPIGAEGRPIHQVAGPNQPGGRKKTAALRCQEEMMKGMTVVRTQRSFLKAEANACLAAVDEASAKVCRSAWANARAAVSSTHC